MNKSARSLVDLLHLPAIRFAVHQPTPHARPILAAAVRVPPSAHPVGTLVRIPARLAPRQLVRRMAAKAVAGFSGPLYEKHGPQSM